MRSKQMFGKSDLIDSLSRDLARARNKRDALASDAKTLTAKIAELEARLSAERDRRERKHAVSEMEGIKKRVSDQYLALAPVISGIREATEMAAAIVPEGHAINDLLPVIATEVANSIDSLLGDLDRRIDLLRASPAAPELPQSLNGSPELPQNGDHVLRLPEWLPRWQSEKTESVEDRCRTAAV
jgi:outer membrane murein-binding lipoprotein Lpp